MTLKELRESAGTTNWLFDGMSKRKIFMCEFFAKISIIMTKLKLWIRGITK